MVNRYPGRCATCRKQVDSEQGHALKRNGRWLVYCDQHVPERRQSTERRLTADGRVITPYDPQQLPLLRAMPGARWDRDGKCWRVSTSQADRPRLLELAEKLKLEVALRQVEETEAARRAREAGLYPFQIQGVDWLARHPRALLADEMGLGKTVQTLLALPEGARAVAVVPAALKFIWRDECKRWRPDLTPHVLSGRGSWRTPGRNDLVITNYDILPDETNLAGCVLIIDEAHKVKSYRAKRSKRVKALAETAAQVWALTGTPLLGRPFDLYGTLQSCGLQRQVFGWRKFLDLFGGVKNRWGGWEFASQAKPEAAERLRRVMIRRRREEVLPDLPGKTYTDLPVNAVTAGTRKRMDVLWETWQDAIEAEVLPPFEEFSELRAALARERIDAVDALVEDAEESDTPLVVFSAHRAPIDHLGEREGWETITGDTPSEQRADTVRRFQDGELRGVAATIQAGGVGLTLTRAWKAVFVDLDWTPANNQQAEDRICRIGQRSNRVEIVRMVGTHILDQHVQKLLIEKQRLIESAIEHELKLDVAPGQAGETEEEYQARMRAIEELAAKAEREAQAKRCQQIHERERARFASAGRMLLPLTEERTRAVRDAFQFLLSCCDGAVARDDAGFNKPDAAIAHHVLSYGLEDTRELETAYMIVSRYHRQCGHIEGLFETRKEA